MRRTLATLACIATLVGLAPFLLAPGVPAGLPGAVPACDWSSLTTGICQQEVAGYLATIDDGNPSDLPNRCSKTAPNQGGGTQLVTCQYDGADWVEFAASTFSGDATDVPYTPTTPGDWPDPDPTEAGEGLDKLASLITAGGGAKTVVTSASELQTCLTTNVTGTGDGDVSICKLGVPVLEISSKQTYAIPAPTGRRVVVLDCDDAMIVFSGATNDEPALQFARNAAGDGSGIDIILDRCHGKDVGTATGSSFVSYSSGVGNPKKTRIFIRDSSAEGFERGILSESTTGTGEGAFFAVWRSRVVDFTERAFTIDSASGSSINSQHTLMSIGNEIRSLAGSKPTVFHLRGHANPPLHALSSGDHLWDVGPILDGQNASLQINSFAKSVGGPGVDPIFILGATGGGSCASVNGRLQVSRAIGGGLAIARILCNRDSDLVIERVRGAGDSVSDANGLWDTKAVLFTSDPGTTVAATTLGTFTVRFRGTGSFAGRFIEPRLSRSFSNSEGRYSVELPSGDRYEARGSTIGPVSAGEFAARFARTRAYTQRVCKSIQNFATGTGSVDLLRALGPAIATIGQCVTDDASALSIDVTYPTGVVETVACGAEGTQTITATGLSTLDVALSVGTGRRIRPGSFYAINTDANPRVLWDEGLLAGSTIYVGGWVSEGSETNTNEAISAGQAATGTLSNTPVIPGSLTATASTKTATDDGGGKWIGSDLATATPFSGEDLNATHDTTWISGTTIRKVGDPNGDGTAENAPIALGTVRITWPGCGGTCEINDFATPGVLAGSGSSTTGTVSTAGAITISGILDFSNATETATASYDGLDPANSINYDTGAVSITWDADPSATTNVDYNYSSRFAIESATSATPQLRVALEGASGTDFSARWIELPSAGTFYDFMQTGRKYPVEEWQKISVAVNSGTPGSGTNQTEVCVPISGEVMAIP